jgi:hypothetical protein
MRAWQLFWEFSLWIAGAAFAGITVIVTVRGFADLRDMFRNLQRQGPKS